MSTYSSASKSKTYSPHCLGCLGHRLRLDPTVMANDVHQSSGSGVKCLRHADVDPAVPDVAGLPDQQYLQNCKKKNGTA